jgi:two-component system OmpR family response regulator
MKILYLEDDFDLSSTIEEYLVDNGFDVTTVSTSDDVLDHTYNNNYDLFIFDVQVPGMDGFELLKTLRESNINTPAIFTTSRNTIDDLTMGYYVGADDYIKKPFALKELLLRVNAILKREFKNSSEQIQIEKNITFNINTNTLSIDDKHIKLNLKEAELLKLLYKNQNSCVSFDSIFETVWSFDETHSEQSLRTYIKNIRKLIGKEKIISIKKQGYMFV